MKAFLVALILALHAAQAQDRTLNVYNWTDYIDPEALKKFTAETGIKINYDVYDSLETLEGKLLAGHSGYDIVVPTSEPTFSRLVRDHALLKLGLSKIPNSANEDPALLKKVATSDPTGGHGLIYLWGTIGLAILPDKLHQLDPAADFQTWQLLLKPENAKRFAPCGITMMDSGTDVIPSILNYLHHSPDSTSTADLEDVSRTLMAIRPYIRSFATSGDIEQLASGETCLSFSYSGDAIQAAARVTKTEKPEYIVPKEGAQLWFDMIAIPADAPHPDLAMQFINFMLQPDIMAGVSNTVRYANALPKSAPFLKPEIAGDPAIYPPADIQNRLFTISAVSPAAERARSRMWSRFKAGN